MSTMRGDADCEDSCKKEGKVRVHKTGIESAVEMVYVNSRVSKTVK